MTIDRTDVVKAYKSFAGDLLRNPDDPGALINQMALLLDNGDRGNASHYLCLAQRAWRNAPDDISAMFNLGSALQRAGHFRSAADLYAQCVAKNDPEWQARSMHHLGVAYRSLGKNRVAIECYEKALVLTPERLDYVKDLALALLADGQWSRGLETFEVRKDVAYEKLKWNKGELVSQQKLPEGVIHWKGESLEGKSVVVYHEEGIGDFIHFCRFIPMLRQRGARLVRLTGAVPDLLELIADNIAVDGIVPLAGPFDCDYVVGSMSVPWRCGSTLEQVNGKPYFAAEPATFPLRGLLNVGLVWRGNSAYAKDVERSMAFSTLCPLFEIPDIAFYSLQVGDAAREITTLGFDGFIADLAPFAKNWRATARLIKRLDAIVTVDTAVAHLAGALGVPVIIMITEACDWRWNPNRAHTRWYDSMRVTRQYKHGDWRPCVEFAKGMLEEMLNERRQIGGTNRSSATRLCAAE